jgi:hypothetical protein
MTSTLRLVAVAIALYAALIAVLIVLGFVEGPAKAGIVEDPVTHWRTYVPDTSYPQPIPPPQWNQPNWNQPLQPPPRVQTTCYLIGNILTCY